MQLCALDSNNQLIFAGKAKKQQDYICLGCGQKVRVRSGVHRKPHFYHLMPNRRCAQHAKGIVHINLQHLLASLLPLNDVQLEFRFPLISRIADVVWMSKRLVFEIQCSSITAEEVRRRNHSYASIGYQVVWIFHDSRYNQKKQTAAEQVLLSWPHYFSDMDAKGIGGIYDQLSYTKKGMRVRKLPKLSIKIDHPIDISKEVPKHRSSHAFIERLNKWPLCFKGDGIDLYLNENQEELLDSQRVFLKELKAWMDEEHIDYLKQWTKAILERLSAAYLSVFRLILERFCR